MKTYTNIADFESDWHDKNHVFSISTSGSTGSPKVVELDRVKIEFSCNQTLKAIPTIASQKMLCCLPTNKMGGFMQLARALVWNCEIDILQPSSNPIAQLMPNHKYRNISLSALQLFNILNEESDRLKLSRFKTILIGGGVVSAYLESQMLKMNHQGFFITYGMTETYSHIALRKPGEEYYKLLSGTKIRSNEDGLLSISSFLTDDIWLNANDIVQLNRNDEFKVLGRSDSVINTGGLKIQAEELEELLGKKLKLPFFITGTPDAKLGEAITLVIADSDPIKLDDINEIISASVGSRFKIQRIIQQDVEMDNSTGKIKRYIN